MPHLSASRTYPVPVDRAFDILLPAPLSEIFSRRFGPMPPITGVTGQTGDWGEPGQQRTIELADGGTMRETLGTVERPSGFTYTIDDVTGVMKTLVERADGAWAFEVAGTGVRITWSWDITPAGSVGSLAMPVFGKLWQGYARQALEEIEGILLRG